MDIDGDLRAELVDVLGQILHIAYRFDVDIASELGRKWLSHT